MCGRYTLIRLNDVIERFPWIERGATDLVPRYNVAPSQVVPIVDGHDGNPGLRLASWGFTPRWAGPAHKLKPINAKSETVATSPMFRDAFKHRRCLVPADGFYEWQGAKPPKVPHRIRMRDESVFYFAGIREGDTVAILTTTPNAVLEPIHNRMPVIVGADGFDRWLSPGVDVADLLRPYDADAMEAYPVSTRVNNVRNDAPELVQRDA